MSANLADELVAKQLAARLSRAVLETVVGAGSAPEGIMHLAFQSSGLPSKFTTLGMFNSILANLARLGYITRENHLVTPTAKGIALVRK